MIRGAPQYPPVQYKLNIVLIDDPIIANQPVEVSYRMGITNNQEPRLAGFDLLPHWSDSGDANFQQALGEFGKACDDQVLA